MSQINKRPLDVAHHVEIPGGGPSKQLHLDSPSLSHLEKEEQTDPIILEKAHPTTHFKNNQEQNESSERSSSPSLLEASQLSTSSSTSNADRKKKQKVHKIDGRWVFPEFTRGQTSKARRLLKEEGTFDFLQKYLPDQASSSDLLYLIALLGFNSIRLAKDLKDDDEDEEKNLKYVVDLLRKAMDRVYSTRIRLGSITTVDAALEQIKNAKNILVLTGAGISTSLGIPDFRSAKGIYANLPDLQLDDPQEVFDLRIFRENPSIFFSVAHMILPPSGSYTPLHSFIKLLNDKGKLLRNYTQNIDNLEENVGIPADKMIQCHGSFARATCQTCRWQCKGSLVAKYIRNQELPICKHCGAERKKRFEKNPDYFPQSFGVVKPDITFFGEDLPQRFHDNLLKDVSECDLLLCIGTSLKVAPVSEIVNKIPHHVPQVLINKDMINHTEFDVSLLGYCDDVASYICEKLGWEIGHPNFQKIVKGGLDIESVDDEVGIYNVTGHWKNNEEIDNKIPNVNTDVAT